MELFDSHCHLNDDKFEQDREQIIKSIYDEGITKLINAGYDIKSSKEAIELAKKYDFIFATCGISPNDVPTSLEKVEDELKELEKLLQNKKIVAIGEIGLDYYWNKDNKQIQEEMFIKQIDIANKYNLPIVIHTREAVDDTLKILRQHQVIKKGVFHCCPLNKELVKQALSLGFYISFSGPITFKNSKNADEIINMVPLEKMLIETDSPYLSPEPNRGKRNDSRNVKYNAIKIAQLRNINIEEIAKITYKNAETIFEI